MFLTALLNTALGAEAADVRQRLFRCVSIRENETARMPSPPCSMSGKEAIVDNGAHFDGDQSGTVMVSRRQRCST
ncbi:putative phage host specificity domain protein [Escherichia coli BCE002_MS12]|nr:putative phage host specificity domain protein [Escherichia coli BCE002_MS12]